MKKRITVFICLFLACLTCCLIATAEDAVATESMTQGRQILYPYMSKAFSYNADYGFYMCHTGRSMNLLKYAFPADGDASTVLWKSSDESILTINKNGVATTTGKGKVTITCTDLSGKVLETISVFAEVWTGTPVVTNYRYQMNMGDSLALNVVIMPYDPSLKVEFDLGTAAGYIDIDENGYLTALKPVSSSISYTVNTLNESGYHVSDITVTILSITENPPTALLNMPARLNLLAGNSATLAYLSPDNCSMDFYSFAVEDTSIASAFVYSDDVNPDKYYISVTGHKVGNTTMTVKLLNGKSYTCLITVDAPSIYMEIKPLGPSGQIPVLRVGNSLQLSATNIKGVTGYTIGWLSDDESILSVDLLSGKVLAKKAGICEVAAIIMDRNNYDRYYITSILIEVVNSMPTLNLPNRSAYLATKLGDYYYVDVPLRVDRATNIYGNIEQFYGRTSVLASSNAENEAFWALPQMDSAPYIHGNAQYNEAYLRLVLKKCGPVDIKLAIDNGLYNEKTYYSFIVTIIGDDVDSIHLDDMNVILGYDTPLDVTYKLDGQVTDAYLPLNWSTSDPSVATVTADGILKTKAAGTTLLTATTINAQNATLTAQATLTIMPETPVTVFSPTGSIRLPMGESRMIDWSISPDDGRMVTFTSSNPSAVRVDANGKVTAIAEGASTITLSAGKNSPTTSLMVYVMPAAESIELNHDDAYFLFLEPGETFKAEATVLPENAYNKTVTWTSTDSDYVTVDQTGLITAFQEGIAIVNAQCGNASKLIYVLVYEPTGDITSSSKGGLMLVGESKQLYMTDASGNTVPNSNLLWESSNPQAISVTSKGLVTALREGEADISITTRDGSGSQVIPIIARNELPILKLPSGLQTIDEEAFAGTTFFARLVVGENVTAINARAFADCTTLSAATIMNPNTTIAASAFDGCAEGFTIHCKKDSAVWKQAVGYGWAVEEIAK